MLGSVYTGNVLLLEVIQLRVFAVVIHNFYVAWFKREYDLVSINETNECLEQDVLCNKLVY